MKILLRNVQTRVYYSLLDVWTKNPAFAYDFRHSNHAFDFARKNELADVQVVVKFEGSALEEIVPLPQQVATLSPRVEA